ncbi:2906_t:CDS:1, partial [Cetraspora pellucida]
MSRISLICLVRGQPATCAFVVDIESNKYISHLKSVIKRVRSPEYKHIVADKLRLWKIEIPDSRDEEITNYSLDSQDELIAASPINNYWSVSPPARHVHVIVVPPGTAEIISSEEQNRDTSSETTSSKKHKESTSKKNTPNKKQNKVTSPVTSTNKKQSKVNPQTTSTNKKQKEVAQSEATSNTKQGEKQTTASNKKRKEMSPPETEPNNKREKITSSPVAPAKNRKTATPKQGVTETRTGTSQDARLRKLDGILNDLLADVMEDVRTNEDTFHD